MRYHILSVNWTAQQLSEEELLVLRNIAALHLRKGYKHSEIDFTHELLEGRLTRKSEGLFVTFVGTFFHANLGLVKGEHWTVDFLLPRGSENLIIDDSSFVLSTRPLSTGGLEIKEVDHTITNVSEQSFFNPLF